MPIVNFSIPHPLDAQIKKTIKIKGFASKAEFFRFAALQVLGSLGQTQHTDEIIREARREYKTGNYKTFRSAEAALKELKRR